MTDKLLDSKTMKLVLLTMGLIFLVFLVAVVLQAVFNIRVPYVAETISGLTGNSGIGAARNAYVDAPVRREQAQASVAKKGDW